MSKYVKLADMTPAQKRVAIARDVIKHLQAKRFVTVTNILWRFKGLSIAEKVNQKRIKTLLKIKPCEVCAIGACVIAGLNRFNQVEFKGVNGAEYEELSLQQWFSINQLALIEIGYEGKNYNFSNSVRSDAAVSFFYKHCDNDTRLIAIMQNIIKNKGEFVP